MVHLEVHAVKRVESLQSHVVNHACCTIGGISKKKEEEEEVKRNQLLDTWE